MNYLQRSFFFLVYSNLFIAACAILMTWQTSRLLLGQEPNPDLLRFVFFSTICSYSFHYYFTTHSQLPSPRITWTRNHKPLLLVLFITGLAGSAFYFFRLWDYKSWLLPAIIATFLYSAPKIPHPLFGWLRKIAIGKTIFLAFAWMYVTAVLPVVAGNAAWGPGFTLFAASRYFFIYSICILFDYRDREDDKVNGVKSLVTFLSRQQIQWLLLLALILSFVLTTLLLNFGFSNPEVIILLVPVCILAGICRPALRHFSDLLYYVILDGLMALSAVLMLVARI